ncbi:MAG: hypothetical protein WC740_12095 [Verrucomicrobiia bacterium]
MKHLHFILCALIATSASPLVAATRNESSYLKISADAAGGRATLLDKQSGVTWDLGPGADVAISKDGRSAVIHRTATGKDGVRLLDGALEIANPMGVVPWCPRARGY